MLAVEYGLILCAIVRVHIFNSATGQWSPALRKALSVVRNNTTMQILRVIAFSAFWLPMIGLAQEDYTTSRFNIDENGFKGITREDTTKFTDGNIAFIGNYAIDKSGIVSGVKVGLWRGYYPNGQLKFKGNYAMHSIRYQKGKGDVRLESSYREGLWEYYYQDGQLMAKGTYIIKYIPFSSGVPNQYSKKSMIGEDWEMYNEDGSVANDRLRIQIKMEYNPHSY